MIWLFGLITGLAFDLPTWWWLTGFVMAAISSDTKVTIDKQREIK